jgi:hypothetical protein
VQSKPIQFLILVLIISVFSKCSIPSYRINSEVKDISTISKPIAVVYTQYANIAIGNEATKVLVKELKNCKNLNLIFPDSVESLLYRNKLTISARMSNAALEDLSKALGNNYLLISQLGEWREVEFNVRRGPKVSLTLLLYDLQNKKLIWSCSGVVESNLVEGPIQGANRATTEMANLVKKQFSKWPAFCQN